MNIKDKKYINEQIEQAVKNKKLYKKLGVDYIGEYNFWNGYINALEVFKLAEKLNYK